MNPLRTTVVMKTDISGSTSRFRELLAADLQALLSEHRDFLARHAAEHDGSIIKGAGDGYWLEFPSVTSAAKAAIAMQEALRLAQLNRGDDRLAIRIVIALGDIAVQDGDFIGDAFALAARVEAVTPADEIYLTTAARLAITSAEIQTALVENFVFKGFAERMPIYRIEQRHRTRVIADTYILFSDLEGFGTMLDAGPASATVERILDALDAVTRGIAQEFCGTVRFNLGDSLLCNFYRRRAGHCRGRTIDSRTGKQFGTGSNSAARSVSGFTVAPFIHSDPFSTAATFGSRRDCRMHRPSSWTAMSTASSSLAQSAARYWAILRTTGSSLSRCSRRQQPLQDLRSIACAMKDPISRHAVAGDWQALQLFLPALQGRTRASSGNV